MANEATPIELLGNNSAGEQLRFTCADGTAITKGTILKLTNPRTASIASATTDKIVGIAAMDKEANDGSTEISVYTNGVFEMAASGSISAGGRVEKTNGANNEVQASTSTDPAVVIGIALDNASGDKVAVRMIK